MNANIELALWIAHPVLELVLVAIMLRRGLHRTFPVFFAYTAFEVVDFLILFPIYRSGGIMPYFYAYWLSAAISLAIGFKVIHEIFLDVLRPYPNLKDLGTLLFKWAALVMFLVAMVVTTLDVDRSKTTRLAELRLQSKNMAMTWLDMLLSVTLRPMARFTRL